MQILRNEIRTGLLVVLTLGLATAVVLYLYSPGVFKPLHKFHVYFDDAAGIKPGAPVMLAGRKIGTVSNIQSPVPRDRRPPGKVNYEADVTVDVESDSKLYRETNVTMRTFGLLADLVVDFTNGNPDSGLATSGDSFVGTRAPDLSEIGPQVIQKLEPALREATSTLIQLRHTAQNLTGLTEKDSVVINRLNGTLTNFESVGSNLKTMTEKNGPLAATFERLQGVLENAQNITGQLQKDNRLEKTLANLDSSSVRLNGVLGRVQGTLNGALPQVTGIVGDLGQLTNKLKAQPWRLVWPSTIKYEGQEAAPPRVPRKRSVGIEDRRQGRR
jgi:phospholipid/cholesterol/gamma-HCH transport system substrate-binding protein